jgi:long-chain fatty acid transport protein
MKCSAWTSLVVCTAAWMVSSIAQASPLLELMGDFGGTGGQQARNTATGASAAYFNPALLSDAPTGLTLGVVVLGSRIGVALQGRGDGSYDVPEGLENASHADGSRFDSYPIATDTLQHGREESPSQSATASRPRQAAGSGRQNVVYGAIGVVAHFFEQRLAIGFCGLIPMGDFTQLRSFYVDEREQYTSNSLHPELYGDRLYAISFGFGLAYRFTKRFSLGLGSGITIHAGSASPAYVADAGKLDGLVLNVDVKVKAGLAPYGGFAYRPFDRWRITGTVHAPQEIAVDNEIAFLLGTGVEQTSSLKLLFDWMPWQVGLGTTLDLIQRERSVLTLAGSALYARWSGYLDRHGEKPAPEFGWYDTITGSVGLRAVHGAWSSGADFQYKPTPVPLQRGRSNYVDNDRLGLSASVEYTFPVRDTKLKLGAQLQGFWLLNRFARKLTPPTFPDGANRTPALVTDELPDDARIGTRAVADADGLQTNNPGWPGFSSKGWLASMGFYLAVTL